MRLLDAAIKMESGKRERGGALRDGVPSLGGEHLNVDGSINWSPEKMKYVSQEFFSSMRKGILEPNDVLVVKDGATTGKTAFVDALPVDAAINEHLFLLRFSNPTMAKYVFHYLASPEGQGSILDHFRGSAIGGIGRAFGNIEIPWPSVEEAGAVVERLDSIRTRIGECREQIELFDELVKSRFVEMFGDIEQGSARYPIMQVGDIASCIVPGRDKPKSFTGSTPWITTDDLIQAGVTLKSTAGSGLTQTEIESVRAKIIPAGSVIMTCVGRLGICSIAGADMVVNQQLHTFQCGPGLDKTYLLWALLMRKRYMEENAKSVTVPYLNKKTCNSIPICLPPLALQQEFAAFVQQIDKLKFETQQAIEKLQLLYDSLAQEYFGS